MPPQRHLKLSSSPNQPGPMPFLPIERKETQNIRYQTPQPSVVPTHHLTLTPAPTPPPSSASKMPRLSKPKFAPSKERVVKPDHPQETVNYPPHWPLSREINRNMIRAMDLYPADDIRLYTRRIPFKGAKEFFLKKTGRNRFDANDTFGNEKQWWIMWDYYNGLVRVHDFFDCCKPGKTEPGNAVKDKVNPGLSEISHNITGGYWLPYEAAKALAAKFCYNIRYALTILFGEDFPDLCLPETHEEYGKFEIDPAIIVECQMKAKEQFKVEQQRLLESSQSPATSSRYNTPIVSTPARSTPSAYSSRNTPERESRFFDPVRNDYTSGGSTRSQSSSPWSGLRQSLVMGYDRQDSPLPPIQQYRPSIEPVTPAAAPVTFGTPSQVGDSYNYSKGSRRGPPTEHPEPSQAPKRLKLSRQAFTNSPFSSCLSPAPPPAGRQIDQSPFQPSRIGQINDTPEDPDTLLRVEAACALVKMGIEDHELGYQRRRAERQHTMPSRRSSF
ncbi:hypothetical protein EDC01DRAFT_629043 [Geopyxis carbonaria]|nr:hypothetical protein EDC01DRAFT_629043 [Geopyxis carbonaria]